MIPQSEVLANECNVNGNVALIVDVLKEDILDSLRQNQIKALFTLSDAMLTNDASHKLIEKAVQNGHELGYRVHFANDAEMKKVDDNKMVENFKRTKELIKTLFKVEAKFVMFPLVQDATMKTRFANNAVRAGMKGVQHNIYLGDTVLEKIRNQITLKFFASKEKSSYIGLVDGTTANVKDVLDFYKKTATSWQLKIVPMSTCLSTLQRVDQVPPSRTNLNTKHLAPRTTKKHHHHHHHDKKPKNRILVNPKFIAKEGHKVQKHSHKKGKGKGKGKGNFDLDQQGLVDTDGTKQTALMGDTTQGGDLKGQAKLATDSDGVDGKKDDDTKDGKKDGSTDGKPIDEKCSGFGLSTGIAFLLAAACIGLFAYVMYLRSNRS
jgi:hypothetical protein